MISFTRLAGLGEPPFSEDGLDRCLVWDFFWLQPRKLWYPLAITACSNGHLASVSPQIHLIAEDGSLSPSYVCPRKDCGFHEFVRLDSWNER